MVEIEWAARAVEDLRSIHDYIARDSVRYALVMTERVTSAVEALRHHPESGSLVQPLAEGSYREVVVRPYRVIYRFDAATSRLLVLAVIHGRRDLRSAFHGVT